MGELMFLPFLLIRTMIELQYRLKRAIEEERYEDAAEIQRQMDELEVLYRFLFLMNERTGNGDI